MPRTRPLTEAQRLAEQEKKCTQVFLAALGAYTYSHATTESVVAAAVGIDPATLTRWKKDPGKISMSKARRLARAIKMTPEQWLAFGGYKTG